MDDAYDLLNSVKIKDESFSDVIRRLVCGKINIMEFAGVWSDLSNKEIKEIKTEIKNLRKISTNQLLRNIQKK